MQTCVLRITEPICEVNRKTNELCPTPSSPKPSFTTTVCDAHMVNYCGGDGSYLDGNYGAALGVEGHGVHCGWLGSVVGKTGRAF